MKWVYYWRQAVLNVVLRRWPQQGDRVEGALHDRLGQRPRAPEAGYDEFTMALFFLWGPMKSDLLGLLESTVRSVEARFDEAEPSADP